MSIAIKQGKLLVPAAQAQIRAKGMERPGFFSDYTMIDIETTGLLPYRDRVTELGGVRVRDSRVVETFSQLVRYPGNNVVPAFITKLNGITEQQLLTEGQPVTKAVAAFREFIGDDLIVGYNVNFDLNFVYDLVAKQHLPLLSNDYVDVLRIARAFYPHERHNRLLDVMQRAGIAEVEQHHGLADSLDTIKVYQDFRRNAVPEVLTKAQANLKNADLLIAAPLSSYRSPVMGKTVVLTGDLAVDRTELATAIKHLGGQVDTTVSPLTNLVIAGNHDYFNRKNADLKQVATYAAAGADLRRWSEQFFWSRLDDWARS